uniref:CobW/HypB/UreG nucleotide-binding domain-containing protein n=1 Tax=Tetradesmus obliquus TaxID=3088 RepID=A0A383VMH9_TETOB|eukprot:jgi/Sobl393_1/5751/SZX66100.1
MTQPRRLKLPIPVTIITGALGVGKTTAICTLLQNKPSHEVWCIIVNEFGAVGLDAVAIEASCPDGSAVVKQLAGGCMCCVLSGPLSAAIAQIIRQAKPDRVIIEPSGLGHPGGLIDILQGPHLCTSLQLNAVICLVDLSVFDPATLMANSTAADQVTVADVLVGSKADAAAAAGAAEALQQWAADKLFPVKQEVVISAHGQLDTCWLHAPRSAAAAALMVKPGSSSSRARQQQAAADTSLQGMQLRDQPASKAAQEGTAAPAAAVNAASAGQPCRVPGTGLQAAGCGSCGWVFDQQDIFDQVLLLQLLQLVQPAVLRLKGVFRVAQKQWVMPLSLPAPQQQQQQQQQAVLPTTELDELQQSTASSKAWQLQPVCYRGPSMVEVIVSTPPAAVMTAEATGVTSNPEAQLHAALNAFLQQQNGAAGGGSQCSEAQGAAQAGAGIGKLSLNGAASLQLNSTWQLLEEALLACLQRK